MRRRTVLAALVFAGPALAEPAAVEVRDAFARATPAGATTGAAYATLTSRAGDVLLGASSAAAARVAVHEMRMDGAIMRMRALPAGLPLPAGQPVALRPGGYHLMLEGLTGPLRLGQVVTVRLTFRDAPPMDVQVPVQAAGAAGPPMDHGAMPGMTHGK